MGVPEKVKEILGMTLLYSFVLLFNAQLVLGQGRSCRTLIVSGRDAVTRDIDGTYKLMNNHWVKMDSTGRRGSYSNTRYIISTGNQWQIIRATRTGGTENYVSAIALKTGSCPADSIWKVYLYGNRYEPSNGISVTSSDTITQKSCRTFIVGRRSVCLQFVGKYGVSDASSVCRSKQGKLPLPKNQRENEDYMNAFRTMLKERGELSRFVALDANDVDSEGNFTSSTGKSVEWFNWREGEPNNQGDEHYVFMYVSEELNLFSAGEWNDIPDSFDLGVFCEFGL